MILDRIAPEIFNEKSKPHWDESTGSKTQIKLKIEKTVGIRKENSDATWGENERKQVSEILALKINKRPIFQC